MKDLKGKQLEVLLLIAELKKDGISPTCSYLAELKGVSHPTMRQHLLALERKGYIEWIERFGGMSRCTSAKTIQIKTPLLFEEDNLQIIQA